MILKIVKRGIFDFFHLKVDFSWRDHSDYIPEGSLEEGLGNSEWETDEDPWAPLRFHCLVFA